MGTPGKKCGLKRGHVEPQPVVRLLVQYPGILG
jgi:hypothetical protein